jgi:hypothetical protein
MRWLTGPFRWLLGLARTVLHWLTAQRNAIDAFNKVAIAAVAIAAPFIANRFEQHMSGISLLSQREQAESQLRATMFNNLITPVVGGTKESELDTPREAVLTELLALNFHEHFELKPLLEYVYARASGDSTTRAGLRSIGRRVIDRQLATLFAEGQSAGRPARTSTIIVRPSFPDSDNPVNRQFFRGLGLRHMVEIDSPDGDYTTFLWTDHPNWDDDNIQVFVRILNQRTKDTKRGTRADFLLSPFDFPVTDNTRLDDGNRFAVVVQNGSTELRARREFRIGFIWFPKGYTPPHERPLDYREFQKLVGKGSS